MSEKYEILIAGGGLVGASLACALRGQSLRIAIIEAQTWAAPRQAGDERVIALSEGSRRILKRLGVWENIAAHVTAIRFIHVSDQGHCGFTRLSHREIGVEALCYVIEACFLRRGLQTTLKNQARITIYDESEVKQVITSPQSVETQITGKKNTVLQAKLLVAANGGNSALTQQIELPMRRRDYQQTAIIATVIPSHPKLYTAFERFTPTGPLALLPMAEGCYSLVWTVQSEQTEEWLSWADETFLDRLQQHFGWRLGRFLSVSKRYAYPLQLAQMTKFIFPRLVFIGNAAHTIHPVGGQGFNLGLRDAAALADVLLASNQQNEEIGSIEMLRRYESARSDDQQQTIWFTDSLARLFSNNFFPAVISRNMGMLLLDQFSGVKNRFIRQAAGLKQF